MVKILAINKYCSKLRVLKYGCAPEWRKIMDQPKVSELAKKWTILANFDRPTIETVVCQRSSWTNFCQRLLWTNFCQLLFDDYYRLTFIDCCSLTFIDHFWMIVGSKVLLTIFFCDRCWSTLINHLPMIIASQLSTTIFRWLLSTNLGHLLFDDYYRPTFFDRFSVIVTGQLSSNN